MAPFAPTTATPDAVLDVVPAAVVVVVEMHGTVVEVVLVVDVVDEVVLVVDDEVVDDEVVDDDVVVDGVVVEVVDEMHATVVVVPAGSVVVVVAAVDTVTVRVTADTELSVSSEAVMVWVPAVLSVTEKVAVPLLNAVAAGSVAAESLELSWMSSVDEVSVVPESSAVTVTLIGVPKVAVLGPVNSIVGVPLDASVVVVSSASVVVVEDEVVVVVVAPCPVEGPGMADQVKPLGSLVDAVNVTSAFHQSVTAWVAWSQQRMPVSSTAVVCPEGMIPPLTWGLVLANE